jgi:hypothetical protein
MRIAVAGASGLIGRAVCRLLAETEHEVTALVRNPTAARTVLPESVSIIQWNVDVSVDWESTVAEADAVINLAGEPLSGQRWNGEYKRLLRASRLETTHALVRAWRNAERKGGVLLNASAVGYYGDCGEAPLTEDCRRGDGFLAELCGDWEEEALKAREMEARVVLLRTGIVLAKDGGALLRRIKPFQWFVGGPLGSGRQWMPWIHIEDAARMILWALEETSVSGPINVCAPHPVRMREFASTLGVILGRPALLRIPGFVLSLILGEMAQTILASQRAVPDVASRGGFQWKYPRLLPALRSLLRT